MVSSNLHIMTSPGGGPLTFHNIQEIVDIELMFELISIFILFLSSLQMIRKRGNNSKTGQSSTLLLCHSKIHVPIV